MAETYSFKAFASQAELANNTPDTLSPIGELSVYAQTFVRDRPLFSTGQELQDLPGTPISSETTLETDLIVFSSRRADTLAQVEVPSYLAYLGKMLSMWVYGTGGNAGFDEDEDNARTQYLSQDDLPVVDDLEMGTMVQAGVANTYYPSWITFTITKANLIAYMRDINVPVDAGQEALAYLDECRVKIWFADSSFRGQFDEYEINHIAPIAVLDNFFQSSSQVRSQVNARTVPMLMTQIHAVSSNDPYTNAISHNYIYHDPNDENVLITTTWTAVVYGAAGMGADVIKESLANWILANSTHTREEWTAIFPDIFLTTEFVITPMWQLYGIPNQTLVQGVHSPVLDIQDAMAIGVKTTTGLGYTQNQIINSMVSVGTPYKSLSMVAVAGPENREGARKFKEVHGDYISVPTSSPDFGRMQPSTQAWVMLLYQLLNAAENMTELNEMPEGVSRTRRTNLDGDTIMYASANIDDISYLVISKESMLELFPAENPEIDPDDIPLSLLPATDLPLETEPGSKALSVDFEAIGGTAPYTYTVEDSDEFAAHSMGPATGQLEITFEQFGTYPITVKVVDSLSHEYEGVYQVNVQSN